MSPILYGMFLNFSGTHNIVCILGQENDQIIQVPKQETDKTDHIFAPQKMIKLPMLLLKKINKIDHIFPQENYKIPYVVIQENNKIDYIIHKKSENELHSYTRNWYRWLISNTQKLKLTTFVNKRIKIDNIPTQEN